jgi:hypothetical protein
MANSEGMLNAHKSTRLDMAVQRVIIAAGSAAAGAFVILLKTEAVVPLRHLSSAKSDIFFQNETRAPVAKGDCGSAFRTCTC